MPSDNGVVDSEVGGDVSLVPVHSDDDDSEWEGDRSDSSKESKEAEFRRTENRILCLGLYWFAVTSGIGLLYKHAAGTFIKDDLVLWSFAFGTAFFLNPFSAQPQEETTHNLVQGLVTSTSMSMSSLLGPTDPKRRRRFYDLDNLKSFLISMVVVHHVALAHSIGNINGINIGGWDGRDWFRNNILRIGTVGQSFGMTLFFFISGYLTPISYDRKGPFLFLQGKFQRLAVPLLIWEFILNPLLEWWLHGVVMNDKHWGGFMCDDGPLWFVKALLLWTVLYALTSGMDPVELPLPGYWKIIGFAAVASMAETMRVHFGLNRLVHWVGVPLASGVVQMLAFFGGCVAGRNNWMEALAERRQSKRFTAQMYGFAAFGTFAIIWVENQLMNDLDQDGPKSMDLRDEKYDDHPGRGWAIVRTFSLFLLTAYGTAIGFALLDFFGRFFNAQGPVAKGLSRASYTVYLIHPLIWNLVLWSSVKFQEHRGMTFHFVLKDGTPTNIQEHTAKSLFWSFLYTVIVSELVVWPLSWGICHLPGINKVF